MRTRQAQWLGPAALLPPMATHSAMCGSDAAHRDIGPRVGGGGGARPVRRRGMVGAIAASTVVAAACCVRVRQAGRHARPRSAAAAAPAAGSREMCARAEAGGRARARVAGRRARPAFIAARRDGQAARVVRRRRHDESEPARRRAWLARHCTSTAAGANARRRVSEAEPPLSTDRPRQHRAPERAREVTASARRDHTRAAAKKRVRDSR